MSKITGKTSQIKIVRSELLTQFQNHFSDFLRDLDQVLDKRLVKTCGKLLEVLWLIRSTSGLLLSELGAYILSPMKAPAGTKRLSNLLRSAKWSAEHVRAYLYKRGAAYVEKSLQSNRTMLLIWDTSQIEKPESQYLEGLTTLVCQKMKRLARFRLRFSGVYKGPKVNVTGYRWAGLLLCNLSGGQQLWDFSWWTNRGDSTTRFIELRWKLLKEVRKHLGNQVLHVFDRGFAGKPWLTLLCQGQDRFVMRWPKHYNLIDTKGRIKKAYLHSVGKKTMSSRKYWDQKTKEWKKQRIVYMPVRHPELPDVLLYLVISRPLKKGKQPWYLLTNEIVDSKTKAWEIVRAYQKRWQIEMTFRFAKSELAIDSPRLWKWENRMKFLAIVALVYDFLCTLLQPKNFRLARKIIRLGCHRTGNKLKKVSLPMYRLRQACFNLIILNQNSG